MSPTAPDQNTVAAAKDASSSRTEPDWTDQVTDLIVDVVDRVHDKATGPLLQASRVLVYGAVAFIVGFFLLVALIIMSVRLLDLLPGDLWIAYAWAGAVLTLAGMFSWSKRRAPTL